jgi:cytochrome c biogenesis protein CcmG, thiol:disulfide interchange protein DsbE
MGEREVHPRAAGRGTRPLVGPFTGRHLIALAVSLGATGLLLMLLTSPLGAPGQSGGPAPGSSFYIVGERREGLAVGERPPELRGPGGPLVDLAGEAIDLAGMQGRPVWVVFWATWCPPCQQETPDLQRAFEDNRVSDLEVVAVNVQESAEIARAYADTYGLTYRIALDPAADAFREWGIFGLPTHYFIDRDGIIRDRYFGPLTRGEMQRRIDVIARGS